MSPFSSLRSRLVLAAFLTSATICGIFSLGLNLAIDVAEDQLFESHLATDAATFMAQYERDPSIVSLPRHNFLVHVADDGSKISLPDYLKGLSPDDDDVFIGKEEFDLLVERRGSTTFYFMFPEGDFDDYETSINWAMSLISGGILVVIVWLTYLLGSNIIRPLTDLSNQVANLDETRNERIDLNGQADPHDEVTVLASAFNGYLVRINELVRREHEFSSDVSHELRTPLMAIQGATEILHKRLQDDARAVDLIARIKRGGQQMTTLTEALLFLARDPASFKDLIEPVSIEKVVSDQVAAVRDVTDKKGIKVNIENDVDMTVDTIPAVINIVIGNILKNAVKYTNRNVINVFLTKDEVVIQDYGPGIDESVQATLFDRFNRGKNRNPDGTGIGLALVRRFCDQYGWSIDFYSEKDKGTRVAVAF